MPDGLFVGVPAIGPTGRAVAFAELAEGARTVVGARAVGPAIWSACPLFRALLARGRSPRRTEALDPHPRDEWTWDFLADTWPGIVVLTDSVFGAWELAAHPLRGVDRWRWASVPRPAVGAIDPTADIRAHLARLPIGTRIRWAGDARPTHLAATAADLGLILDLGRQQ